MCLYIFKGENAKREHVRVTVSHQRNTKMKVNEIYGAGEKGAGYQKAFLFFFFLMVKREILLTGQLYIFWVHPKNSYQIPKTDTFFSFFIFSHKREIESYEKGKRRITDECF